MRARRALSLSPRATFIHVLLPAIAPQLLTGMRIGLSLTLLGTLIGEMFGGEHGIGYMLVRAINLADNDTTMAPALLLMVFAIGANWLLGLAVRRAAGGGNRARRSGRAHVFDHDDAGRRAPSTAYWAPCAATVTSARWDRN